jgi:predicted nucleic acid-binding protein
VKRLILIDSSFFIALSNNKDQWHNRAIKVFNNIQNEEKIIVDVIILESITLIGSLAKGKIAKALYDNIKDNYAIIETNKLYDKAMETYLHYDGVLSLFDVLQIEIMKIYNIDKIVSFDSDFDKVKGITRIH